MNRKQKKVAFVASIYGHIKAFHIPIINRLRDRGIEVHVYAYDDGNKEELLALNIICHDIDLIRNPFNKKNFRVILRLKKSFQQEKFDIVHVHTPVASVLGRIAAKFAKVPTIIYTAHGFHFYKGASWFNWITFYIIEYCLSYLTDILITINEEDTLRAKSFKVKQEVLYVPGVGVDIQKFSSRKSMEVEMELKSELSINEKQFVILTVAELIERKNYGQLIDSILELKNKGYSVKCLIVGIGDLKGVLEERVNHLGLENIISFLGFRRDIPELMSLSDVVVLLSRQEGLPKALLEALASGKPIITTDVRGNRELVENGVNGYLVNVDDVISTVQRLEDIINNKELQNEMGIRSKSRSNEYDIKNVLSILENIYIKALKM
ncbi:glycosyltransferase family 4 protein [Paenibacillus pedocola]|uniref:glycosyltransferase family 4 protein n=1 Tax=Paenibacillus pedocola TaxID=3242193 RepID=UPI002877CA6A|nr:glycosyltransferase family 4 protein [Paenibacillus typhae]